MGRFSTPVGASRGEAAVLLLLVAWVAVAAGEGVEKLCSKCVCSSTLLNCTLLGLQKLPVEEEAWPEDVEEALFDRNSLMVIVHLPNLPKLRRLSFRRNNIQIIRKSAFCNLTSLQELDLGSNELSQPELDPDIFQGPYVENEFMPLSNLTVLRLDSNSIHSLSSDFFEHLPRLRELSLAFNPIRVIDTPTLQAISSLAHLRALDLTHVGISKLPPYILHTLRNLTVLNISANSFTEVPPELANAHHLEELRLSSNPILSLEEGSFPPSMASLKQLHMDYMHNLTHVGPGGLWPLKSLKVLRITHSLGFSRIDGHAFVGKTDSEGNTSYPLLEELVLRGNGLRTLEPEMLTHWDSLRFLDLEDNRWLCDCEMTWMVDILEPIINRSKPELLRNFICEDPEPMQGQSIFSLNARHYHLRCLDADDAHPERDGLILVGVLVGVLLAVPATLAAVLCWRRGSSWIGSGPAAYSRAFYRRAHNVDDF